STLFAGLGKQHRKLLAADSRGQIDTSCPFAQDFAEAANRLVAGVVTEAVVESLETVDINHQQAERMAVTSHAGHLSLQLALEPSAVCDAGQVVRKSRFFANVEIGLELEQCPG